MPRIDDTLEMLGGASYFAAMDLAQGYYQVPIHEDDQEKTAFSTHRGYFMFRILPFGLCQGPGTFERLMENVLHGLIGVQALVYLDDVVTWGNTVEECCDRLDVILGRLIKAGLKVKGKKCQFFKEEIKYLGHIVSRKGVACDPDKVAAVQE